MATWNETASSMLLCAEDNSSILGFDDEEEYVSGGAEKANGSYGPSAHQNGSFCTDFFMGFHPQSDECLGLLVLKESDHLPREDYAKRLQSGSLDVSVRRDAIDWIGKVHSYYSFGPLSAYLSVNYLDRFLSAYELPQGKAWMTQLLSVACLSLAAKMEETEVPLSLDLQIGEAKFIFEARTIQRMELLVLSTLKWRMQAVTPFSFIDYFIRKYNDGKPLKEPLLSQSVEFILSTVKRIDFLEFRPSEVAAAVALSAVGEIQTLDTSKALSCCIHVQKERVLGCYELIRDMALTRRHSKNTGRSVSVPSSVSPVGVLDAACLSYRSDNTTTVGSQAKSDHTSPDAKRRKLNRVPTS